MCLFSLFSPFRLIGTLDPSSTKLQHFPHISKTHPPSRAPRGFACQPLCEKNYNCRIW